MKRRSLLPQFSRKGSSDEHSSVFGAGLREVMGEQMAQGDKIILRPESRDARAEADTFEKPSLASRLGRPRPISMMPTMDGFRSKHVDPSSRVIRGTSQDLDEGASSKTKLSSGMTARTANGHRHTRTQTLDSAPKRSESNISTSVPTPLIPSRTTSAKPSHNSSRASSQRIANDVGIELNSNSKLYSARANENHIRSSSSNVAANAVQTSNISPSDEARSSATGANRTSPPRSQITSRGRMPPASSVAIPKPAFNVYQQHYSPAKSALPKPPVPTTRTSSTKALGGINSLSAEADAAGEGDLSVVRQQIELLQLMLLYDSSLETTESYDATAKRKLGLKHARLGREYEKVRVEELQFQKRDNLEALGSWCQSHDRLVENLQILSMVHSDLTALLTNGSRHHELISTFEKWTETTDSTANAEATFVQPLPNEWKTLHTSLGLKLRGIQRNLSVLPLPPPAHNTSSSEGVGSQPLALVTVLTSCKELIDNLQQELDTMLKVEKEVLARESVRVDDEAKELAMDYRSESALIRGQWTPAWHRSRGIVA